MGTRPRMQKWEEALVVPYILPFIESKFRVWVPSESSQGHVSIVRVRAAWGKSAISLHSLQASNALAMHLYMFSRMPTGRPREELTIIYFGASTQTSECLSCTGTGDPVHEDCKQNMHSSSIGDGVDSRLSARSKLPNCVPSCLTGPGNSPPRRRATPRRRLRAVVPPARPAGTP